MIKPLMMGSGPVRPFGQGNGIAQSLMGLGSSRPFGMPAGTPMPNEQMGQAPQAAPQMQQAMAQGAGAATAQGPQIFWQNNGQYASPQQSSQMQQAMQQGLGAFSAGSMPQQAQNAANQAGQAQQVNIPMAQGVAQSAAIPWQGQRPQQPQGRPMQPMQRGTGVSPGIYR